ncbi:MAG: hypothetical protein EPN79_03915 [Burkholderiaceae bacterium]|nr:MAG: hypothetical protein EPN79_03915 [Burkholderiaceae bacterium]TBR77826.1 MAG: hypothetical protein EPN64_00320 [Burkholderiaceae bacterium]
MKRISIKLALVAALTVASTMAFAADPGQPAKPAPNMQGVGNMPMGHGKMGSNGHMGGDMMSMMGSCQAMMGHGGMLGSAMTLNMPPGNEKLEFQMHAEMMQKMGEIAAKYADQIKESR